MLWNGKGDPSLDALPKNGARRITIIRKVTKKSKGEHENIPKNGIEGSKKDPSQDEEALLRKQSVDMHEFMKKVHGSPQKVCEMSSPDIVDLVSLHAFHNCNF